MKYLLLIFFTLNNLKADIDSLEIELSKASNINKKFAITNKIAEEYLEINPDKSIEYSKLGMNLIDNSDLKDSIYISYENLANAYFNKGLYVQSLNYYKKENEILKENNNQYKLNKNYNNLGNVYFRMKDFDRAIYYYSKSYEYALKINDSLIQSSFFNNMGLIYKKKKEYDSAISYFKTSLNLKKNTEEANKLSSYFNIAQTHFLAKNYDKSLEVLSLAFDLEESDQDNYFKVMAYSLKSRIFASQKDFDKAQIHIDTAINIALETNLSNHLKNSYFDKYYLYLKKNDYNNALKYYIKYSDLNDSLLRADKLDFYDSLTKSFDLKAHKEDIKKLNNKNKQTESLIYVIIILSVLLIISLIYFILNLNKKHKNNQMLNNYLEDKNEELNTLIAEKEKLITSNDRTLEELSNYQTELEYQNRELINSEFEIQKLKNKYFEIFDYAPIAYINLDEEYRIIDCNKRTNEIFEKPKNEIIKKNIIHFFDEESSDKFHFFKDRINDTNILEKELTIVINDSKVKHCLFEFKLFYDESAKTNIIFTTVIDISEKRKLEKNLYSLNKNLENIIEERTKYLQKTLEDKQKAEYEIKEREEFIRTFTEKLPVGVYRTTPDGKIIFANKKLAEILGFESEKELMLNYAHDFFIDKKMRKHLIDNIDKDFNVYELKMKTKNGKEIWVRDTGAAVKDENGDMIYLDGVLEDITDKKISEQKIESMYIKLKETKNQLEEANRLKAIILGNLSHELRTPLNGILGFSQLLLDDITDEEQNDMMKMINTSASRLHKTLNSLLSITEIEANLTDVNLSYVELELILDNILNQFYDVVNEKNIDLKIENNIKNSIIYVDEFLINQAIFNVIDNAMKFTQNNEIKISLENSDSKNYLKLNIEDNGIGIQKDKLDSIFEAFRQESEGYNRKFEGIGIGLTITKKISKILKCKLKIKSEINKGTHVVLEIPVNEQVFRYS